MVLSCDDLRTCSRPLHLRLFTSLEATDGSCFADSECLDIGCGLLQLSSSQINNALSPLHRQRYTTQSIHPEREEDICFLLFYFCVISGPRQQELVIMRLLATVLGALSVVAVVAAPEPSENEKGTLYISPSGQSSRLSRQQQQSLIDLMLHFPGSDLNIPVSCRPFSLYLGLSRSSGRRQLRSR